MYNIHIAVNVRSVYLIEKSHVYTVYAYNNVYHLGAADKRTLCVTRSCSI